MNRTAWALITAIAVIAIGCDEGTDASEGAEAPAEGASDETAEAEPAEEEAAEDPGGPQSDTPLPEYMQEHFAEGTQIRDALTRGDLEEAQSTARTFSEREPTASFPPSWSTYVTNIRDAAGEVAEAEDLDQAALRFGAMANVCADCHGSVGASIELEAVPAPEGEDTATHMQRHQWALDRMWEGLVIPADDRWSAGAGALAEAPLHPHALAEDQTVPEDLAQLATRVHSLGTNASQTADAEQRAQLYGELSSTCHGCHTQVEGAPGAEPAE
ncbi:MAG TPA: hypothetical protein RMH99_16845 [Sandaracinaceae bacterium LLY-WYZ-13_1]|nr:hypothetical protein [Sandaracinaceae bacterium LLY-WYZ-13_1]